MSPQVPPQWLEGMLLWCVPARHRETISGDLLEEYQEEQAPRFGRFRTNLWYLRQIVSFLPAWNPDRSLMKMLLTVDL